MPTTCTRSTAGPTSDYVFVNIWAEPKGQAWSYPAVYDLVVRMRARTGLDFDPHWFRHCGGDAGGCATACPSRSSPSSWVTRR